MLSGRLWRTDGRVQGLAAIRGEWVGLPRGGTPQDGSCAGFPEPRPDTGHVRSASGGCPCGQSAQPAVAVGKFLGREFAVDPVPLRDAGAHGGDGAAGLAGVGCVKDARGDACVDDPAEEGLLAITGCNVFRARGSLKAADLAQGDEGEFPRCAWKRVRQRESVSFAARRADSARRQAAQALGAPPVPTTPPSSAHKESWCSRCVSARRLHQQVVRIFRLL